MSLYSFDLFDPAPDLGGGDAEIVLSLSTDGAEWGRVLPVRPVAESDGSFFTSDDVAGLVRPMAACAGRCGVAVDVSGVGVVVADRAAPPVHR